MTTLPATDWKAVRYWVLTHPGQTYRARDCSCCPLAIILGEQWKERWKLVHVDNAVISAHEKDNPELLRHARVTTDEEEAFISEVDEADTGRMLCNYEILAILDHLGLGKDYTETQPAPPRTFKVEF